MSELHRVSEDGVRFLERYASEVAMLANGLAALQDALSSIQARQLAPEAAIGLQRLDEYTQKAAALAQLADQIGKAPVLDHEAVLLLTSSVRLAELAARLEGDTQRGSADASEVELF